MLKIICTSLVMLITLMFGFHIVLSCSVMSSSLGPHRLYPARLLCQWDSPGKNRGVDSHSLLQGIFPTQGSNPCLLCLLHWQAGPGNHFAMHQKLTQHCKSNYTSILKKDMAKLNTTIDSPN